MGVPDLLTFDEEDVEEYLLKHDICSDVAANFRKNQVTGEAFLKLTEGDLKELVPLVGIRTKIRDLMKKHKPDIASSCESQAHHTNQVDVVEKASPMQASDNWHLSFKIPEKHSFSHCVQKAIENGMVSSKARREIVQTLRTHIVQHTKYMTSEQYTTISRKLILKYPKLRDSLGTNGFGSWKEALRNSIKNYRRGQPSTPDKTVRKLSVSSSSETPLKRLRTTMDADILEEDYDRYVAELVEEWKKGKKNMSMAIIKDLLTKTDSGRRCWMMKERPLITEILLKFPCLGNSRMIRRDFRHLLAHEDQVSSFKGKSQYWMEMIVKVAECESSRPAIKKLLENIPAVNDEDDECNSVVLEILIKLMYPRGPGKNFIFAKKIETCDIDLSSEVEIITQSEPYIVILGEAGTEIVQYFVCGEKVIICESKSLIDAIIDLIGTYYIFDIVYPKQIAGLLLFFQQCVFKISDDQIPPPCLSKLLKNCESFMQ